MTSRSFKRAVVIFSYIAVSLLIVIVLYFMLKSDPSCNDGIENQGEIGVDCGGPCRPCPQLIELKPLSVVKTEWVHDVDNKYDIVAEVENINDFYGASVFSFRAIATTPDGSKVSQERWQKSFALPGADKFLFIHGFELSQTPNDIKVEIKEGSDRWSKFSNFESPEFVINNSGYKEREGAIANFSAATGTMINRNTTDFETVNVHVILRDDQGNMLAINSQEMNAVLAGQNRDYNMIFPHAFPGSVSEVVVFVETNPFDSDNYIKTHGKPDKWDETPINVR